MPVDTRLADTASELLDNLATALTNEGLDVPERQYVHAGQVSYDFTGRNCTDLFVVSWMISAQGEIGVGIPPVIKCAVPMSARFDIHLIRCVPTLRQTAGKPIFPSAEDLHASGEQIMTDAMTLAKVIVAEATAKTLFSGKEFLTVGIGQVTPYGPQGGAGGTVVTLFANLVGA